MINLTAARLARFVTHQVGNRLQDEEMELATEASVVDEGTADLFLRYLLQALNPLEPYVFYHPTDLGLNDVYAVVTRLFEAGGDEAAFMDVSQDLARLLYEQSMHPKIKGGKLNVVWFEDVLIEDETLEAVGIFKSETDAPFLQMQDEGAHVRVTHQTGYDLKAMDKGCLIVNTNRDEGYEVLVVDKRGQDTRYWVEEFLKVRPLSTNFHQTRQAMAVTKNFLTRQAPKEFEIEKSEQINLLNKSVEYFGKKEVFSKEEFEEEVLQDERLIDSFRSYNDTLRAEPGATHFDDEFNISSQAYKKQSKIFKSVLKLDKNFHVYIHGDKELIEKGQDAHGRKFYKLYYEEEN